VHDGTKRLRVSNFIQTELAHSARFRFGFGAVLKVFAMVPMRQIDDPRCSTCNDEMELTVVIPPFGSAYGLKVYTCPKCGRSQDYLVTSLSKLETPAAVAACPLHLRFCCKSWSCRTAGAIL
jgi:hypothetical protein